MEDLVLFCKSYDKDMLRAKRMAESVQRFNRDSIPLIMCVPQSDYKTFKECFKGITCTFLTDERVLEESFKINGKLPSLYPPHLLQQLIKLEFWRLGYCRNYAWIDSDSYFIRSFKISDFLVDSHTPYFIQDPFTAETARQRWQGVSRKELNKRITDRITLIEKFRGLFNNSGPLYNFAGSTPIIWSVKVLQHLYQDYLHPKNKSIYELLFEYPCETHLYGEYFHFSRPITIHPKTHLFKSYLYLDEFVKSQIAGENEYSLAQSYLGICIQSNWTFVKDRKNPIDRLVKHLKEYQVVLGRLKFNKLKE
jgi:hypothetical protein